ncbi:MAG: hypothetical protein QY330_02620 [Candidatus Dojkabacteria bacterium]|nr:MAG: hypothetical protein QY330_02620 [Candidatus Dojkabacteria bacterium]
MQETALGLPHSGKTGPLDPSRLESSSTTYTNGNNHATPPTTNTAEATERVATVDEIEAYINGRLSEHNLTPERVVRIQDRITQDFLSGRNVVSYPLGRLTNSSEQPLLSLGDQDFTELMHQEIERFFHGHEHPLSLSFLNWSTMSSIIRKVGDERYGTFVEKKGWAIPTFSGLDVDPGDLNAIHAVLMLAPNGGDPVELKHAGSMRIVFSDIPENPNADLLSIIENWPFLATTHIKNGRDGEITVPQAIRDACKIPDLTGLERAIRQGNVVTYERLIGANYKEIFGENKKVGFRNGTLAAMGVITLLASARLLSRRSRQQDPIRYVVLQADSLNHEIYKANFGEGMGIFTIHEHAEALKKDNGTDYRSDKTFTSIIDLKQAQKYIRENVPTLAGFAEYALNLVREP